MLRHFTGLKDTDLFIFTYVDDVTLCNLTKTCKYFRGLLQFDNLFWKDRIQRLFQLSNTEFTHVFSDVVYDSCWKNYYTRVLSDQRRIFREWSKTSLLMKPFTSHLVNPNLSQVTDLSKDNRLDLLMYIHMTPAVKQLIRDAITATSPNLITVCFRHGRVKILEWLVDMGYTFIEPRMTRVRDDTINDVSLWDAATNCQLELLDYYKNTYDMVPHPAENLDDGYRTVWYNTAIAFLKLDKSNLLSVLDWFLHNQLVDTGLKIILIEIVCSHEAIEWPYQRSILGWCKQNQVNLCVNTTHNPYIQACCNYKYTILNIYELLYEYNVIPTRDIVRTLKDESLFTINTWLRAKSLD